VDQGATSGLCKRRAEVDSGSREVDSGAASISGQWRTEVDSGPAFALRRQSARLTLTMSAESEIARAPPPDDQTPE